MINKKGAVLVVAITAMVIMIVIGAVCLQIYTNQSLMDSYDQIKMRTFYSAEGALEMMRGYIVRMTENNLTNTGSERGDSMYGGRGFLASVTKYNNKTGKPTVWEPFKDAAGSTKLLKGSFDGTMYPGIAAEVSVRRLTSADKTTLINNKIRFKPAPAAENQIYAVMSSETQDINNFRGYEIYATAYTTHKTTMGSNVIRTTLRYYFFTERKSVTYGSGSTEYKVFTNDIKWVGWRRD